MPAGRRDPSNIREKIIYDTAYDAVVTLNVFKIENLNNKLKMKLAISSTGFIVDIIQNRIIVLTCAHNILTDYSKINSEPYPTISATVTGAYQAGSKIKNEIPVVVSLRLLGMDIAADIAVLHSILPGEATDGSLVGYRFCNRTQQLDWMTRPVLYGETVYTIGNMYGSNLGMITGNCVDDNLIYLPRSVVYINNLQQIATTLAVKEGAVGGPILCYDDESQRAVICGIVQWSKINNNYTCGLNTTSLRNIYRIIYNLNISCRSIKPNRLNFIGATGKGYDGTIYQHISGRILTNLGFKNPNFNQSKYRNQVSGVIIREFSNTTRVIPNSRVDNAMNISKCDYLKRNTRAATISEDKIKTGDIIMEINGQRLGDEEQDMRLSDICYYNAGKVVLIKCLRPATVQVRYYKFIIDEYPAELEYVSKDDSIELLALFPSPRDNTDNL